MSTNVRFFLSHYTFKSLAVPPPYIFPRKCDIVYSNVIINDVICAPFVTALLKRSGETKIDIVPALLDRRLCDKNCFKCLCRKG